MPNSRFDVQEWSFTLSSSIFCSFVFNCNAFWSASSLSCLSCSFSSSSLFSSLAVYLKRSTATIFRIYTLYEPLRTLFYIGGVIGLVGILGVLRFLFFFFTGSGDGHIQSLVLSGVFLIIGFQVWMLGIIADLISVNRRLGEEILYRTKKHGMSLAEEGARVSNKAPRATRIRNSQKSRVARI